MRTAIVLLLTLLPPLISAEPKREMVPMRDGVRLSTMVALPAGSGPFPAVLIRTPYAMAATAGEDLVGAGYAVVQQNLRGLFESEGKWPVFATEIQDGYDAVEWVAAQPWSNGKVGVLGGSGPGIAGYMALMSGAPHLSAGFIQYAHASTYPSVTYPGGVYQAGLLDSWVKARGVAIPPAFPRPLFRKFDKEFVKQDIHTHAANVRAPIMHVTGWFDIFTQGTIDYFLEAQSKGVDKAKGNQKLIIRPAGHGGRLPGDLQWTGDLAGGDNLARRWFDYWLRDIDTGIHRMPAVQYYMMGDARTGTAPGNGWRSGAAWPPITEPVSFYLQPGGGLSRTAPAPAVGSASYDYNPADPAPSVLSKPGDWLNRTPLDQRALKNRTDILRFTSLPRTEDVEIAGPVTAELFVSTTARDTDFFVRLVDIYPDGYEALMMSQPLRLRFREGFERMVSARRNKIYKLEVKLWSLALAIPKGHRIGVQITSSDWPRFDKHTNTWNPVTSYDQSVKATNTIHVSSQYPSRIILPVLPARR